MQPLKSYVRVDEHGVMRVGSSRAMLDSVVTSFEQGCSPETIHQQYPALSLEEVYGAITWYLANAEEVARYLERQNALWAQGRAKADTTRPTCRALSVVRKRSGNSTSLLKPVSMTAGQS
jgi:uncharacterized protein (DUF433 family)